MQNTGNQTEVVADNLEVPWAMAFLPDGRMIFTERPGRVNILEGNQVKLVANITTTANGESGLLGVAVDPKFDQNRYIYLYYTSGNFNRVSRFILNEKLENETIFLDNIPASQVHDGGRLKFGPDGKLYITTGDASQRDLAQDKNSLAGKILRMNPDGSVPTDNPFGNYVYSYGHRNPQGIAWGSDGIMYSSEHGQTKNDEINIIVNGSNYGWPVIEGNQTFPGMVTPLRVFTEFTLAPSGLAYYRGSLYQTGLRGNQLRQIKLSADGKTVVGEEALLQDLGRIRDVVEYNGYLYISTSNLDGRGIPKSGDDRIIRMKIS
ncbi:MAG: PQQ-dependent sugar dehydrogenase [Methanobacteriales archaeon]|nr:PQQ-dependent sugar dehydrogenase [Methanobacteriales archaeon]